LASDAPRIVTGAATRAPGGVGSWADLMASHDGTDAELDIDLLAASLRADASDLSAYTEALAAKLEEALPAGVTVQRGRQGMFGPRRVRAISVDAGGERLMLQTDGDQIATSCARVSGGIVLKTEPIAFETWLDRLSRNLAARARESQGTRQALQRLLDA
jgi:hypothetical protein